MKFSKFRKWTYQNEELGGEGSGGSSSGGTGSQGESGGLDIGNAVNEISESLFSDGDLGDGGKAEGGEVEVKQPALTEAKPSPATTPAAPAKPPGEVTNVSPEQTPPAATPAPGPDDLPKTWKQTDELKAKWAATDPAVKAEILRREDDMYKGFEQYRGDAQIGKTMKAVISPFLPVLNHYNIDPAQLTGQLLKAHHDLSLGSHAQKVAAFRELAQSYQVNLDEVSAEAPYEDPQVRALREENQRLQSERQRAAEQAQSTTQQMLTSQLDTFFGDPKNEFAKEVMADMVPFVKAGLDLPEAYKKACRVNEVVWGKLQAREQATREAEAKAQAAAELEKARAATAANVKTRSRHGSETGPLGSMEETMMETLRNMKSRT